MYFSTLKIMIFLFWSSKWKEITPKEINLSKEDIELFKATKCCSALGFFPFAKDPDLKSVKFALKCKPNHGFQIDFTRPG